MQEAMTNPPILIFGATGAIGEASSRQINNSDGNIILSASKESEKIKKLSGELSAPYIICDLDKKFDSKKLTQQILKNSSILGGLIISIARPFPHKLIHNTDEEILKEQLSTHIVSFHRIIRTCVPFLESARKFCTPRIIYISTEYLLGSPPTKIGPYLAAKSAANTYAKVLAKELLKKGIKVFILAPGMIRSRLTENLPEEYLLQIEKKLPNKRLTTPNEISEAVTAIISGNLDGAYGNEIQISNAERR